MKHLLIILLSLTSSLLLNAQNETGTQPKNANAQKIRSLINDDNYTSKNEQLKDTTPLLTHTIDYIPKGIAVKGKKEAIRETYHHWRYGFSSGVGLRIAPVSSKLSSSLAERKRNLRFGAFAGVDANHFFSEHVGLGVKYNLFKSSNFINDFTGLLPYYDEEVTGTITDNVLIHYIGPSFVLRTISYNKKIHASYDLSIGYTGYYNNNVINNKAYTITGSNVSFTSTVGADFMVNSGMAIGVNLNIVAASIKKININGVEYHLGDDKIENLSRITLGLILRVYK